jgi:hypothetical protein
MKADMLSVSIHFSYGSDCSGRHIGWPQWGGDAEQFLSSEFTPNFPRAEIEKIIESSLAVPRDYAAKLMLSISYSD